MVNEVLLLYYYNNYNRLCWKAKRTRPD